MNYKKVNPKVDLVMQDGQDPAAHCVGEGRQ